MRARLFGLGLVLVAAAPALAALPPQYQRQAELVAILQDDGVVQAFGIEHLIEGVKLLDTDLYQVTGDGCRMEVRIVDVSRDEGQGFAGPRNFAVEPGELICD